MYKIGDKIKLRNNLSNLDFSKIWIPRYFEYYSNNRNEVYTVIDVTEEYVQIIINMSDCYFPFSYIIKHKRRLEKLKRIWKN